MQPIEWRPVVGYEGSYEVSSDGQVRSLDRIVVRSDGRVRPFPGRLLTPIRDPHTGYMKHGLWRANNLRTRPVHRLMAEAFLTKRPGDVVVCHNDGDKQNNTLENLRWGTLSDNAYDNVKHGGNHNAAKTHCKRGHEFTPANTWVPVSGKRGGRRCKICTTATNNASIARKRARLGYEAVMELAEELNERIEYGE